VNTKYNSQGFESLLTITSLEPEDSGVYACVSLQDPPLHGVDLVCSASGFPTPTYRWFKAVNDDTLAEFDKNQIKLSEAENRAVLSVTASPTTFGQTYKCVATNTYGDADKYYKMLKTEKPEKPSKDTSYWVRVRATNAAGDGPWSDPVVTHTELKSEEPDEVETPEESDKPVAAEVTSNATFYGIFFAGGIAVVAVLYMFAIRLV
ncbi:Down syndrome cell adhesion molecule, partial [Operophtera brumata]